MAEDNRTNLVRTSLIYTYGHFWMKAFPSARPSDLARFSDSPQRQQLFGVDIPGVSHFTRRIDMLAPPTPLHRIQKLGARIAQRMFPLDTLPPRG
jgi:hypothetical protein